MQEIKLETEKRCKRIICKPESPQAITRGNVNDEMEDLEYISFLYSGMYLFKNHEMHDK